MKKIISFNKSGAFRLLLSLVLMLAGIGAQAQEVLELNKEYTLPSFKKTYYVFTPTTSGKLYTYSTNNSSPHVFTSEDLDGEGIDIWTGNYTGNTYITEVEAGKTYYIGTAFAWDETTFHMTMDGIKAVELEYIYPEAGSILSLSKAIDMKFNVPVKVEGAKLAADAVSANVAVNLTNNLWASVAVKKTLYQWMKNGVVQPGDEVTLTLLGVVSLEDESVKAGEDGTITVKFKVPEMPTELTASTVPAEFKKLWRAGDTDGIMTLTFSNDIQSVSSVNITNGDLSYEGNGKQWNVTPTIDGNTVTVDLTDVERMPLAGSSDPEHFTIEVKTVMDVNGNYAYTEDDSSLGSFAWTLDYKGDVSSNVEYMYSPDQENENLKDYLAANERVIMVMVSGDDNYDFSSVSFEYTTANETKTVVVEKANITVDNESGMVLSIPVPAEIDNAADGSQVIMYIMDADNAVLTKATWQYGVAAEFALSLVSPEDGATLEGFKAEADAIKVYVTGVPTDADEVEIVARIYDPENEDPIYTAFLWQTDPAEDETIVYNYAQTIYDNLDFVQGKDYKITITATKITYPAEGGRVEDVIAENVYTIHGAAAPFVYSDIALTDITPNPTTTDIISTDQNTITLTFDGAVNVTKVGTPIGFGAGLSEWTAAKADEEGKVWTVTIPETTITNSKSSFSVSLFVEDAEGNPVYKTTAEGIAEPTQNKENTYYSFTYTCTIGAPDLTVIPEDGTELEVLDKITIKFAKGINPSWTCPENVVLYKGKGTNQEVVKQWDSNYFDMWNEDVCVEYGDDNYAWALNLDAPVTEPGNYTLVIPNGFFNLGSEYDQALNKITNVHYTIKGEEGPVVADKVTTDPEAGSTVTSLKTIKVTWADATDAGVNYEATAPTEPIALLDAEGNVVTTATISMSEDWDDPWNMLVITLENEVTADGTYTLHIPAAIALLNEGSKLSTEQNITYIIGNAAGFSLSLVSPEDGATLEGFKAEADAIKVYVTGVPTDADEVEIVARIYDPENEDPIYTAFLWQTAPAEDETIVYNYAQTIYENLDFVQGKDYKITITATKITYPAEGGRVEEVLAENAYTIHGAAAQYVYSNVTLTDITPNPTTTDIISTDQNTITLTFDGAVNVTKVGTPIGFGAGLSEWTAAKADEEGKVWTVTIPETTITNSKSSFSVSLYVEDAEGNPVYKTTAEGIAEPTQNKENTYYSFTYTCTIGAPDLTVIPEDGTELEVIDKITIKFAKGISPSYTCAENVVLYKGKGTNQEVVKQWDSNYFDMWNEDVCVEFDDSYNYAWALNLDAPVTEPGNYTLVIPNGFFNLGSEYDQALNKITNVHYTIKGEDAPVVTDKVTTDPEAGSTVTSLKTIKVTWADATDAGVNNEATAPTEPIALLDAEGNVVTTATISISEDWDDPWNMLIITLENEVTADGTYTLHIPAAIALLNEGSKLSTEQNITYIIGNEVGIATLPTDTKVLSGNVYTVNGVLVRQAGDSLNGLSSGVYIINGKKVVVK